MPQYISHCLFANEVKEKLNEELKKLVTAHLQTFMLGSQGPDYYFFYHVLPWQNQRKAKDIQLFGTTCHEVKVNDAFKVLFERVKKENDPALTSFALGYICHHALDSFVHPYVYALIKGKNDEDTAHSVIEREIDTGLLKYKHSNVFNYDYRKILRLTKKEKEMIIDVAYEMSKVYQNELINKKIVKDSINDVSKALYFQYDPTGRKYKVFSKLEKMFKLGPMATKVMPPKEYDEKNDALNLRQDKWIDVVSKKIRNDDVIFLYDKAKEKALNTIKAFESFYQNKININLLLIEIGDISYNTGGITTK